MINVVNNFVYDIFQSKAWMLLTKTFCIILVFDAVIHTLCLGIGGLRLMSVQRVEQEEGDYQCKLNPCLHQTDALWLWQFCKILAAYSNVDSFIPPLIMNLSPLAKLICDPQFNKARAPIFSMQVQNVKKSIGNSFMTQVLKGLPLPIQPDLCTL